MHIAGSLRILSRRHFIFAFMLKKVVTLGLSQGIKLDISDNVDSAFLHQLFSVKTSERKMILMAAGCCFSPPIMFPCRSREGRPPGAIEREHLAWAWRT